MRSDRTHVVEIHAGRRLEAAALVGGLAALVIAFAVTFGVTWVVWPDAGLYRSLSLGGAGGFVGAVVGGYLGMATRRSLADTQEVWEAVPVSDGEVVLAVSATDEAAAGIMAEHGGRQVGSAPGAR